MKNIILQKPNSMEELKTAKKKCFLTKLVTIHFFNFKFFDSWNLETIYIRTASYKKSRFGTITGRVGLFY